MPPRRRFDKKNATTFSVVHRAHDDERYFDNDASTYVLVPVNANQKGYTKKELERNLGEDIKNVRDNEGLAAQYGIYYDDSKYDYMQHLRPIGKVEDAVFIAKKGDKDKKKEDLMALLKDQLPSENTRKITQDDLENIPKDLRGFNPDMDPRLREAMEALEDEAYVENEEDDLFNELLQSGKAQDDEYDEWDLDNYQEEYDKYEENYGSDYEVQETPYNEGEAPEDISENDENIIVNRAWEKDFNRFKSEFKNDDDSDNDFDSDVNVAENDTLPELPTNFKKNSKTKQRKKKGAMTDTTSFSMSSSAVYRTEGLTLLDDRYEQLAKKFEEDEEYSHDEFDMKQERGDFESLLDDFLDNYELERGGRKLAKKNEERPNIRQTSNDVSKDKVSARHKKNELDLSKLSLK